MVPKDLQGDSSENSIIKIEKVNHQSAPCRRRLRVILLIGEVYDKNHFGYCFCFGDSFYRCQF